MSIGEDLAAEPDKFIICEHLQDIKAMSDEDIKTKTHWFDAFTEDTKNAKREKHRLVFCQKCAENWVRSNMSNFSVEGTLQ